MAVPRMRPGNYPALLSYGFRPFFLAGAAYSGLAILFWLPLLYGHLETASLFVPVDWHVHEMLFGYLTAVITGFLLTAIPNWTGRLPVQGLPLLLLFLLWLAGRIAVFFSAEIGWLAALLIDSAFLAAVAAAAAIEIVAGRNWRNLKVLLPLAALFCANILFHVEVHFAGVSEISRRLAIAAAIVLIMIIGGRIIPSFTRNWLVRENPGRLPQPFGRADAAIIALSTLALAAWTLSPERSETGLLLLAAGLANAVRLARWAGYRTFRDPLVLILHVAFLFVPLGFLLAGAAAMFPDHVSAVAGIHAFGAGAIGSMTLAVMARATLGHTGRDLKASPPVCAMFTAVVASALLRILAVFFPASTVLLHGSSLLWPVAFLGYVILFGGMLARPRLRARQPNQVPT
ncbi:MAG: NnrS family protein [Rhizobiaceae bacterium]